MGPKPQPRSRTDALAKSVREQQADDMVVNGLLFVPARPGQSSTHRPHLVSARSVGRVGVVLMSQSSPRNGGQRKNHRERMPPARARHRRGQTPGRATFP